jgi:tRNA uridine 5-carbamoylmethylation protein Kti12
LSYVILQDLDLKAIVERMSYEVVVVCVAGIPCSGKSEICRNLGKDWKWIEYDDLESQQLQELLTTQDSTNESHRSVDESNLSLTAWRNARKIALETLEELLRKAEGDGAVETLRTRTQYVILDDNFHLRSMRRDVYQMCLRYSSSCLVYFGVVWVETSLATCLDRNGRRSRVHVDEAVIRKLAQHAERPLLRKDRPDQNPKLGQHLWESACLLVSGEDETIPEATTTVRDFVASLKLTYESLRDDRLEREYRSDGDRRITQQSFLHRLDLSLRRCVKAVAASDPGLGGHANQIRQGILSRSPDRFKDWNVCQLSSAGSEFWSELSKLPTVMEWDDAEYERVKTLVQEAAQEMPFD